MSALARRATATLASTALAAATLAAALAGPVAPAAATPVAPLAPTAAPGSFDEQNLAADRTSASFFYRIPALAHLGDGVVVAAWDARPGSAADSPNPNSIVQRRSTDNGRTWGPMTTIAAGFAGDAATGKYGYSDPSYVVDHEAGKVFAFFVYSKDAGFASSQFGNDDADRDVISAAVVESTDGGLSWSSPRLITDVVKPGTSRTSPQPGDVRSMFASSGEGIQLRHGPHAGRLVQQYAGYVRQSNGTDVIQAWSAYSDDHGVTWRKGVPVGTGMDENKTVELSDGRVMLNSRDSANGKFRKVAISTDGGHSYGPVTVDRQLIDPTNNGSITRLHPDATQGTPDSRKLLFTNSASQTGRENVSARVSCDDGATWPGLRTIRPTFSAYSTATRLDDGRIGVFYEADYTSNMPFASFDDAWLNYVCAPLATPDRTVQAGSTTDVPLTITNQEATTLAGGSATIATPSGWSAPAVAVPSIAPGASVSVTVPLTAPSNANGPTRLDATFTAADGRTSHFGTVVTVQGAAQVGATITGSAAARDLAANPYAVGEALPYSFSVTSTSNVTTDVVPVSGTFDSGFLPPTAPNCRYRGLAAGAAYTCTTARHTVTAADVAKGWFTPKAELTVTSTADPALTRTVSFTGAPVFVRDPAGVPLSASIAGRRTDVSRDLQTDPYAVGELVPYAFDVANTSPFVETVAPTSGSFAPLVPPGSGNCRWTNLAVGGSYTCATPRHTVTQAEADAGFFRARSSWAVTASGKASVTYDVDGGEVDLKVREPGLDGTVTPVFVDVDGDRFASAGDRVDVSRTLGNAGNVSLTGLSVTGADIDATALALGQSVSADESLTLTQEQVDAGRVTVPGFSARAVNGELAASRTVGDVVVTLDVRPAMPATTPDLQRKDYDGLTSPVDLGLERRYRAGQLLVAHGLDHGRWYHLSVNGTRQSLGWHFPSLDDTVELIVPETVKNGMDTLVVIDAEGREVGFGAFHVTPKGR